MSAEIMIGTRVRLRDAHNWLTKFAPLARSGRIGTVTALLPHIRAQVMFDVVKPWAKPITGSFTQADLIVVDSPATYQQELVV